jgi:hypothetical protein
MQGTDRFAAVKAVEHFIERLVADYGAELYVAFCWFSLLVIAWIIARNLRRRTQRRGTISAPIIIILPAASALWPPAFPPTKNPPFPDLPPTDEGDNEDTAFPT